MNNFFHWINGTPENRQRSYDICHMVVMDIKEVIKTGKPYVIDGRLSRKGWEFQYNPAKGETPEGELSRYLKSLRLEGVGYEYDHRKDEYYFFKFKTQ